MVPGQRLPSRQKAATTSPSEDDDGGDDDGGCPYSGETWRLVLALVCVLTAGHHGRLSF